ncbi:hypothetical protein ACLK1T_21115 [Escherichia coli]
MKKTLLYPHCCYDHWSSSPAFADSADTLPDMGTSAGSTLSIGQEMQMGDDYCEPHGGSAPVN